LPDWSSSGELPASRAWLEHARDFADLKWPWLAPASRRSMSEALATVTPALLTAPPPTAVQDRVREALYRWVFQTARRTHVGPHGERREDPPPTELADTVAWLETHTRPLADLWPTSPNRRYRGPPLTNWPAA